VHHPKLPERELTKEDGTLVRERIDGYSRGRENYEGQDHVLLELAPVLKKFPGLHLTGELWKKGQTLQDISGASRRTADSSRGKAAKWDYNVFDCFYIDQPELGYEERQAVLDDVFDALDDQAKYVKRVQSYIVDNKEAAMKLYNKWMAEKLPDGRSVYEGAVIRNLHGPYEFGIDKEKRSYQALKWKPRPDAEWPVIRFKDGVGKEKGQVIWICAENEDGVKRRTGEVLPLEERKTFAVTPNMPIDVRKHIFKKISVDDFFEKNIKGQLYTISYSILSKDFLPQQPKGMRFRDQKINQLLLAGYEGSYEIPEVGEHDVGEADDDDLELDE
jgi:ATP-dependent DNA ligase